MNLTTSLPAINKIAAQDLRRFAVLELCRKYLTPKTRLSDLAFCYRWANHSVLRIHITHKASRKVCPPTSDPMW
jgi:hypothetical protein